jgi:hypothetical protein
VLCPDHDLEIFQEILDKALCLMETSEGKEFLYYHFSVLNYYSSLFRQRGSIHADKRLYEIMKSIYEKNYKTMNVTNSLLFMTYDYEINNGHSEISKLVFDNIINQCQNIEYESIEAVYTSLSQTPFSNELRPKLK